MFSTRKKNQRFSYENQKKNIAWATRNKAPDGKFGDDLICVRYRYDETHMMAIKTVELVVEKTPWKKRPEKIRRDRTIYIHIDYGEIELGRKVREAGGFWNREKSMGNSSFRGFKIES